MATLKLPCGTFGAASVVDVLKLPCGTFEAAFARFRTTMRFASKQGMQIANALHVSDNGWLCTWNESAFSGLHCEREGKVRGMHSQHHNDSFKNFKNINFLFITKFIFSVFFMYFLKEVQC